jgi:formylglycine-generating enzyme required for sulfatase activity
VAPPEASIYTGLVMPGDAFNATTNPGVGAFIYRSANGNGTFTVTNAQLQWNYGANGLTDNMVVDVQVFAIEHVYIPQGSFAAGDGLNDGLGVATQFTVTTINTSDATQRPAGTGTLGGQAGGFPTGQTSPNRLWPNGFNPFYCMKYEISQQGYVDFLNTLNRSQQANRVGANVSSGISSVANTYVMSNGQTMFERNIIRCDANIHPTLPVNFYCDYNGNGIGGEAADGKDIACNYLTWGDMAAYLDWVGLRPMTELEFEKCGRGNLLPVPGEFAWGNTFRSAAPTNSLVDPGLPTEYVNAGNVAAPANPLRVGSFARAGTTRTQAGAGYYGMMELSGNLIERVVTIGVVEGGAFTGSHGNGVLNEDGNLTNTDWPVHSNATGTGFRGGDMSNLFSRLRLSDRSFATFADASRSYSSIHEYGGRGCRSVR